MAFALSVIIGGDIGPLRKALGEADARLDVTKNKMAAVVSVAEKMALATGAAATAIALLVNRALDSADATYKMAQSAGLATQAMSELLYVAKLSDVNAQSFATAMTRLNRNILEASNGTGDASRAFDALGIKVKNADGSLRNADEVLVDIATEFSKMEDGANKSALAVLMLGKSGAELIPMLNQGAGGMKALRQEAIDLGVSITSEAGRAAEEFNDNLRRLHSVLDGLGNKLLAEMLAPMQQVTEQLVESAKHSQEFKESLEGLVKFISGTALTIFQTLTVVGSDIAFVFKMVGGEIGVIAAQLASLFQANPQGKFRLIGEEWTRDAAQARKDLDEFQKRIMDLGKTPPPLAVNKLSDELAAGAPPKSKGPKLADPEALKKEKDRTQKLLEEDAKNWVAHAEAVFKAAEAELAVIAKLNEAKFEAAQKGLESTLAFLGTEEDAENAAHAKRMEALQRALDQKLISQEEYENLAEQMDRKHQENLTKIEEKGLTDREKFERMSMKDKAKTIFGALEDITAGVAQHNKTLFQINKVAAIANAIINAYEGISKTLATYPYPWSVAMAALQGAAAFAQVSAIAGTQFQGGGAGAAPSIAGTTPAPPTSPVPPTGGGGGGAGMNTTVIVQGDFFTEKTVRKMLEEMNAVRTDGGRYDVR